MKALDDVILGVLIFMAIQKLMNAIGDGFITPRIKARVADEDRRTAWKEGFEFAFVLITILLVYRFRKFIAKLDR